MNAALKTDYSCQRGETNWCKKKIKTQIKIFFLKKWCCQAVEFIYLFIFQCLFAARLPVQSEYWFIDTCLIRERVRVEELHLSFCVENPSSRSLTWNWTLTSGLHVTGNFHEVCQGKKKKYMVEIVKTICVGGFVQDQTQISTFL